jgi:chromate reductase
MTGKPTIGILIGSLQTNGLTRKLATAIGKLGADQFDVSVIEIGALPLYNPERESRAWPNGMISARRSRRWTASCS